MPRIQAPIDNAPTPCHNTRWLAPAESRALPTLLLVVGLCRSPGSSSLLDADLTLCHMPGTVYRAGKKLRLLVGLLHPQCFRGAQCGRRHGASLDGHQSVALTAHPWVFLRVRLEFSLYLINSCTSTSSHSAPRRAAQLPHPTPNTLYTTSAHTPSPTMPHSQQSCGSNRSGPCGYTLHRPVPSAMASSFSTLSSAIGAATPVLQTANQPPPMTPPAAQH